jgi:hypothetical protein
MNALLNHIECRPAGNLALRLRGKRNRRNQQEIWLAHLAHLLAKGEQTLCMHVHTFNRIHIKQYAGSAERLDRNVRTFGGALFPRAFLYLSLLYTVAVGAIKAALSTLGETSPVCCICVLGFFFYIRPTSGQLLCRLLARWNVVFY